MAQLYNPNNFTRINVVIEEACLQTSLTMTVSHFTQLLARSFQGFVLQLTLRLTLKMIFKQLGLRIYCPKASVLTLGQWSKSIYKSITCLKCINL